MVLCNADRRTRSTPTSTSVPSCTSTTSPVLRSRRTPRAAQPDGVDLGGGQRVGRGADDGRVLVARPRRRRRRPAQAGHHGARAWTSSRPCSAGRRGRQPYDAESGTSMSTPHIAGIAALIKQQAPDLVADGGQVGADDHATQRTTPGQPDQDAARTTPRRSTTAPATSGRQAFDPGLVYDSGHVDWLPYGCGIGRSSWSRRPGSATAVGRSTRATSTARPSRSATLAGSQTVTRTVTNTSHRPASSTSPRCRPRRGRPSRSHQQGHGAAPAVAVVQASRSPGRRPAEPVDVRVHHVARQARPLGAQPDRRPPGGPRGPELGDGQWHLRVHDVDRQPRLHRHAEHQRGRSGRGGGRDAEHAEADQHHGRRHDPARHHVRQVRDVRRRLPGRDGHRPGRAASDGYRHRGRRHERRRDGGGSGQRQQPGGRHVPGDDRLLRGCDRRRWT